MLLLPGEDQNETGEALLEKDDDDVGTVDVVPQDDARLHESGVIPPPPAPTTKSCFEAVDGRDQARVIMVAAGDVRLASDGVL